MADHPCRMMGAVGHQWFDSWVDQHLGITVTLTRAAQLTDAEVFVAFDADPATAKRLTLAQADDDPDAFRVRIGRRSGWLYTVEHFTALGSGDQVLQTFSADSEAFALSCTMTIDAFCSAHGGQVTTRFDLGLPQFRSGSDRDRYLDEMARAGLLSGDGAPRAGMGLRLLQSITGFGLTAELLEGSLIGAVLRRSS